MRGGRWRAAVVVAGLVVSGLAAPPAARAQQAAPARGPLLVALFLGVNSVQDAGAETGLGLRTGVLAGGRLGDRISLDGEAVFDDVNHTGASPSGETVSTTILQASFAPLYHLPPAGPVEIVVGPKLGFFREANDVTAGPSEVDLSVYGWLVGANAGAFAWLNGRVALGGLVSFDYQYAELCRAPANVTCTIGDHGTKLLSVGAGALF
ncbi:MAG TPA: hypothetical protein VHO06_19460 [Polyangia bacterium]|nr:hypothetical protein [Polyangia bacterium]